MPPLDTSQTYFAHRRTPKIPYCSQLDMSDLHGHMHVTLLFSLHVKQLGKNYLLKFTFASAIKLGGRV